MDVERVTDVSRFVIGGCSPRRACAPLSVEELRDILIIAHKRGEAVVFFGGGTLQGMGNPPTRYDLAVDLRALNKTIAYNHEDLTIAVQAGMTPASLQRTLAQHGQHLPFDVPRPTQSTVGGMLAAGWAGPRRGTYGRPRDLLLGTTVVTADGSIAAAGGMTVKNVTGYDVGKLYVGSLGTLGAIVRANFKTLPRPPAQRMAVISLPEGTRDRAAKHLHTLSVEPTAALIVQGFDLEIEHGDEGDGRMFLLFEGTPALIERATREARSLLGAAGVPGARLIDRGATDVLQRVMDATIAPTGQRSITYRCTGPRTTLADRHTTFTYTVKAAGFATETISDLHTGDLIARVVAPTSDHLEKAIAGLDDMLTDRLTRLTVLRAPDQIRLRLDAWAGAHAAVAQIRAVKQHFDPTGILAPGRLIGGV